MNNILVTGATGFFGKAFIRFVLDMGVQRVCVYSRDEWKQAQMREEFDNDDRLRWFIGDVRDYQRLHRAMSGVDTVIHAAALKRIEVGEYNPDELVKTNVNGAMNVIEAALSTKVKHVVALSTDKAASPYNAYGASKLLSEKLFLAANNIAGQGGPTFAVTRYGNVAGSTGSVIPLWRSLQEAGAPIVVTDPDCTRFWMTSEEAVRLVFWAVGRRDMVVPDLPAYRIEDLIVAMGEKLSDAVKVDMRPGEKKHEAMLSEHECSEFYKSDIYGYWVRGAFEFGDWPLDKPLTSDIARRMSIEELRRGLDEL